MSDAVERIRREMARVLIGQRELVDGLLVALLFLETLDSVIGSLPIVRNVILGKDRNLLALYFRLEGPRDDMSVTPLAPERVRDLVGFASSAVMKGVRSLGKLIPSSGDEVEPNPAPSPTAP